MSTSCSLPIPLRCNLAGARNTGWRSTPADLYLFVDDDNTVAPGTVEELARAASEPSIGLVAPVIYDATPPNRIWCGGVRRSMWTTRTKFLFRNTSGPPTTEPWATDEMPDAFAVPRKVLLKVDGFDEANFPFHYDEADLGARIRRLGLLAVVVPTAVVWHGGGTSSDPGAEMIRAFRLSGPTRVSRMAHARVQFHAMHSSLIQAVVALAIFIPAYTLITATRTLLIAESLGARLAVVSALIRGFATGYSTVTRSAARSLFAALGNRNVR